MRHTTQLNMWVAPNCYRTEIDADGVTHYYSISVKHGTINQNGIDAYNKLTNSKATAFRVVDKSFKRTPYKQCFKKEYDGHFEFCFLTYHIPFEKLGEIKNEAIKRELHRTIKVIQILSEN